MRGWVRPSLFSSALLMRLYNLYIFIRDVPQKDQIAVDFNPSEENQADMLTKALGSQPYHQCISLIGLRSLYDLYDSE